MANGLKSESDVRHTSKEFDAGYERTFGNREPVRGKWWVDPTTGLLVDSPPVPVSARLEINTDTHYDGIRATDGTPLQSRRAHREYMNARGLAIANDFKETWTSAEKRRKAGFVDPSRKDDIARALTNPKKAQSGPINPEE